MEHVLCSLRRGLRRGIVCAAAAVLLLGLLTPPALASGASKKAASRAIAIVFDNSGSMYMNGTQAWCQATYAIEVFTAMLNDGDTLQVYPMNPIEVDGSSYSSDAPLTLTSVTQAPSVRQIYTPRAGGTPIESVTAAHDGLLQLQADERWLIVLTDGATFHQGSYELSASATKARLSELLTEYNADVNVLYLGIGNMSVPDGKDPASPYVYSAITATSSEVPSALSGLCNQIFGRDELPPANMPSDGRISFDIPMSKLIVFIQGDGVSNISLTGSGGASAGIPVSTYAPEYSTLGAQNYESVPDTSLKGVIATYTDFPAGEYTLNFSGDARSITAYYEPDVDLAITVTDADGNPVTKDSTLYPGTYYLTYGMVDKDGNITQSPLLGNTDYTIDYSLSGAPQPQVTASQAGSIPVELSEGDTLDFTGTVTFLSGYRVTRSARDLGWDPTMAVGARPVGDLTIQITGGETSYPLSQLEEQGVYRVSVSYSGVPLTGEELDRLTLDASLSGGNAGCNLERDGDEYVLSLRYAGSAVDTSCGEYTLTVSGAYLNEFDQTASADQSVSFTLEDQTWTLDLDLDIPQNYYVVSQLAEGEPMLVYLSIEDQPLSQEQMDQTTLTAQADGLALIVERLPGEPGYSIRIDPNGGKETGGYRVVVSATAKDPVGRELSAETAGRISLNTIPRWLLILTIVLMIALIALLIWLFLNAKVLPKTVVIMQTIFTVDGSTVRGNAACTYSGGGKKHGSLEIRSPRYTPNPMVNCGFRLDLDAVSPRRTRSSDRKLGVISLGAVNSNAVTSIRIGTAQYIKSEETNRLVRSGGGARAKANAKAGKGKGKANVEFEVSNRAMCTVAAEVVDGDGGSMSVSLVVRLGFR